MDMPAPKKPRSPYLDPFDERDFWRGSKKRFNQPRPEYGPPRVLPPRYEPPPVKPRRSGPPSPTRKPIQTVPWTDEDQKLVDRMFPPKTAKEKRAQKNQQIMRDWRELDDLFKRKKPPPLPRKMVPWPLRDHPIFKYWDWLDLIDEWQRPKSAWRPVPPFNSQLQCVATPEFVAPAPYPNVTHLGFRNGLVNAGDCGLSLQAWSGAESITGAGTSGGTLSGNHTFILLECNVNGPGACNAPASSQDRFRYHSVWHWIKPQPVTFPPGKRFEHLPNSFPNPDPYPNPNEDRRRGPDRTWPGPPSPGDNPDPDSDPVPFPDIAPGRVIEIATGPWSFSGTDSNTGTTTGTDPKTETSPATEYPTVGRTPTATGTRERKFMSTASRLGVGLWRALDSVSEWAEVIDALFEALPEDVRKRWEKDRPKRGLVDQAGQYGIDGADWKAQALFWNLHKLDMQQAVINIIENHLEDKLYGGIHSKLPKQTGAALDGAFKELADLLAELKGIAL